MLFWLKVLARLFNKVLLTGPLSPTGTRRTLLATSEKAAFGGT